MVRMRALCSGGKRVLLQASWQADHWQAQRYVRERTAKQKAWASGLGFADDD